MIQTIPIITNVKSQLEKQDESNVIDELKSNNYALVEGIKYLKNQLQPL